MNALFNEIFNGNGIELNALLCEHASGKIVRRLYEHPQYNLNGNSMFQRLERRCLYVGCSLNYKTM